MKQEDFTDDASTESDTESEVCVHFIFIYMLVQILYLFRVLLQPESSDSDTYTPYAKGKVYILAPLAQMSLNNICHSASGPP